MKPLALPPNTFPRFYRGGERIAKLRGAPVGGRSPEDWIGSVTTAFGAARDGLTRLDNGRTLESGKRYKVAGWASVNEQTGAPIWDVVARHLRSGKPPNRAAPGVTLKGVDGNPGIAGQA